MGRVRFANVVVILLAAMLAVAVIQQFQLAALRRQVEAARELAGAVASERASILAGPAGGEEQELIDKYPL